MSQWIMPSSVQHTAVDLDVVQESALAMAQATIQNAMNESGVTPSRLAKAMGRHRSFVSRMMSGSHNLTFKTFALALGACGYELKLSYTPLRWGWVQPTAPEVSARSISPKTSENFLPTVDGGQFAFNA